MYRVVRMSKFICIYFASYHSIHLYISTFICLPTKSKTYNIICKYIYLFFVYLLRLLRLLIINVTGYNFPVAKALGRISVSSAIGIAGIFSTGAKVLKEAMEGGVSSNNTNSNYSSEESDKDNE